MSPFFRVIGMEIFSPSFPGDFRRDKIAILYYIPGCSMIYLEAILSFQSILLQIRKYNKKLKSHV